MKKNHLVKKFRKLFLITLTMLPFLVKAQDTISGAVSISGGKVIEFANVVFVNRTDSTIVKGGLTDENGRFEIAVPRGAYILTVSFIGYESVRKDIEVSKAMDLGTIQLEANATELNAVAVTSKKPLIEKKIDRFVFNISQSVTAIGGDALDALGKTPGVRVDNDDIGLVSKNGVQVMVNGRLVPLSENDLVNYLKSIRSEDIASIEVITNPPAKYDAGGNSGLINIILKQTHVQNFSGNVRGAYTQSSYPGGYLGADLNYLKNKVYVFGTINLESNSSRSTEHDRLFYPNQTRIGQENTREYSKYLSGRFGLDYKISQKSTIGVQYIGNVASPDANDNTRLDFMSKNNVRDSSLITQGHNDNRNYYHSINAHYQTNFDTLGRKIDVDANYFIYNNVMDRTFSTVTVNNEGNMVDNSRFDAYTPSEQNIKIYTLKADLELPYPFATVSAGGKMSFIRNESSISLHDLIQDTTQSDAFIYDENTQSLYASAKKKINSKWEVMAGLRLEVTETKGNSRSLNRQTDSSYASLFPTAYVMYTANENNTFSLNYGRRISRPGYAKLNPFRWYFNPIYYVEGNPFLRPSFTDNMQLAYTYKDNLIIQVDGSKTSQGFGQVVQVSPNSDIQAITDKNYYTSYQLGWLTSYTLRAFNMWETYNQFYLYYNKTTSTIEELTPETETVSAHFSSNNSFTLNAAKTVFAEVNYTYLFPRKLELYEFTSSSQLDLGIKIELLTGKLQLALNVSDVFSTNRSTNTTYTNGIKQEYRNYYDTRRGRISVVYKFGNKKVQSKRRDLGNEEERGRSSVD